MMKNQFLVSQSERERTVRLLGYGKKALGAVLLVGLVLLGSMSYDGSRYGSSVGSSSGRDLLAIKTQVGLEGNRDGKAADRMNHVAVVLNPAPHILPPLAGTEQYGAIAYVTTSKLMNGQIPEVPKQHKGGISEVIAIKSQTSQSAASDDVSTVYPALPELTITDNNGYISNTDLLLDDNADSYYIIKGDKPTDNAFMVDGDSNRFIIELQRRGFFAHNTVLTIIGGKENTDEDKDNIMAAAKLGYVARVYVNDGDGGNKFISFDIQGEQTPANDVTTIYLLLIKLREDKVFLNDEKLALIADTNVFKAEIDRLKNEVEKFAKNGESREELIAKLRLALRASTEAINQHEATNKKLVQKVEALAAGSTVEHYDTNSHDALLHDPLN